MFAEGNLMQILADKRIAVTNAQALERAQNTLKRHQITLIPEKYCDVLMRMNGFKNDVLCLFGLKPLGRKVQIPDIIEYNLTLNMKYKKNILILGYTVFDWILYDKQKALYLLVDKNDNVVNSFFNDVTDMLAYLKVYL